MAAFIPLELITEILTRLPVKSLNRFKCVSKTWNSIITCSEFIKQHLNQTLISNTTNIIICGSNYLLSSAISDVKLRFDIIIPNLYHILNRPLLNEIPHYPDKIIQSVHGILLMISSSKKTVCLFNPSNKTQRFVPPSPSPKPASDVFGFRYDDVFGFGYDDVTDDYKVVRLVQGETFVYSMRNDSWESVYDDPLPHTRCPHRSGIAVDSTLWFLMISDSWYYMLKCFDLRTSAFSIVNLPEFDRDDIIDMSLSFTSLRGCLCLLVSYLEEDGELLYADAWEINNESKWVKLFKIRKEEIDKDCEYLRLVIYAKDIKSVLVEVDGDWFGWYDLVTTKFKRVPVQGLRARDSPYKAHPFVETLVSAVRL